MSKLESYFLAAAGDTADADAGADTDTDADAGGLPSNSSSAFAISTGDAGPALISILSAKADGLDDFFDGPCPLHR